MCYKFSFYNAKYKFFKNVEKMNIVQMYKWLIIKVIPFKSNKDLFLWDVIHSNIVIPLYEH